MQGGSANSAQVLLDAGGKVVAVLSSWPEAQVYIAEHPSRCLWLVEEPGLLAVIQEYCGRPHVGEEHAH